MPRVIRFHRTGGPEVLEIEDLPLQEPGSGEVRIKVEAFGLNRAEVLFRQGLYLEQPDPPSRIGYEACGVVEAVGPDVSGIGVGDRVGTIPGFSMKKYGVYGENAVVPAKIVAGHPEGLSSKEGAAIWMKYMTAYGALVEYGKVQSGDAVVIPAASSSVGLAAIQIAKDAGATSIATTRGASKKQDLLDAGADHVIVTEEEDVVRRTREITGGRGARLIFDPVSGPFLEKLAGAAARGGVIFEYGSLSMEPTSFPMAHALAKGLSVRGYTLFEITSNPESLERGKAYVYERLSSGAFKPVIARTFTLEETAEAHRFMESNQQLGKIVVTV
jgi:NADPH:quinone reductase-like Zn-dependent oxidoreductase